MDKINTVSRLPLAVIEAPTNLGLRPPAPGRVPGVEAMPERLRELGLARRLGVEAGVRVEPPPYRPERDPATGIRNAEAIASYSRKLAEAVGREVDADQFPLVIGGDCSVLLGSALALARRGRFGLVYFDGHQDFLTPSSSPSGAAAGMGLALVTGHGPPLLTMFGGRHPMLDAETIALIGFRDDDSVYPDPAIAPVREAVCRLHLEDVRAMGPAQAAARALSSVLRTGVDGIWVHLDVDVLDDAIMPAVDDRQPDGLSYAELRGMLAPLLASGWVVGMQITVYDPTLDPDGEAGATFVEALVGVLQPLPVA